jgi:hypothetical protein
LHLTYRADRLGDLTSPRFADELAISAHLTLNFGPYLVGDADAARRGERLQTHRHADRIAAEFATIVVHVAAINANAETDLVLSVRSGHSMLHLQRTSQRVARLVEQRQQCARRLTCDLAAMLADRPGYSFELAILNAGVRNFVS